MVKLQTSTSGQLPEPARRSRQATPRSEKIVPGSVEEGGVPHAPPIKGTKSTPTPKKVETASATKPAVTPKGESFFQKHIGGRPGKSARIAWWHLWKLIGLNAYFQKNSSYAPTREFNLYSTGHALYSGKNNITVLLSLDGYPDKLPIGYVEEIRNVVRSDTRVSFLGEFTPTEIDWNDPRMISRIRSYETLDKNTESETVTEYNYRQNIAALDENERRKSSVLYLSEASVRRDRQMFLYRRLMLVSGTRGDDFDTDLELITRYCHQLGLQVNRITRNIRGALQTMSPTNRQIDRKIYSDLGNNVIPDEMISRFLGYTQGKIGTSGIYMGTDIDSGFPVIKQFKKTNEDAENLLVLAETGWGKSYMVKNILLQLMAWDRVIGTIMDIEGFEYTPVAEYMASESSVVQLNMGEGQGSYFDPVEIVTTGGTVSKDNFTETVSFTTSLFNTLVGDIEGDWVSGIITDAVSGLYADKGIFAGDSSTWSRSKGLTIFDVYRRIKQKQQDSENPSTSDYKTRDEEYKAQLRVIRFRLEQYFEEFGARRDVFRNPVTLRQIQDAKLVVCSFGMASKTPEQVDPVQMGLTQISAANISHIRSLYAKSQGKFNLKVWEELQRWVSFPGSASIITTAATGGRKLGDINVILSNDPTMFIEKGDISGVFNNITSFLIGNVKDADIREEIARRLSVMELLPDLDKLSTESADAESFNNTKVDVSLESPYRRAFLGRFDGAVTCMVKALLPNAVASSQLLKTGSEDQSVQV